MLSLPGSSCWRFVNLQQFKLTEWWNQDSLSVHSVIIIIQIIVSCKYIIKVWWWISWTSCNLSFSSTNCYQNHSYCNCGVRCCYDCGYCVDTGDAACYPNSDDYTVNTLLADGTYCIFEYGFDSWSWSQEK